MLTVKQAASLLGLTPVNVRKACDRGTLKAEKVGRDWIITPEAVEDYRANNMGKPGRKKEKND